MDPITITVSVLSVLTLANNLYETVSRLTKSATSNNRIKTQRISFKIEMVTLQQWLKNCSMSGTPLEGNEEVQELLNEFQTQARRVGEILDHYTFSSDARVPTTKKFASRLKYESGGYEELNEMTLLMEKLNKALQTIAPPLPPGYDLVATGRASDSPETHSRPHRRTARQEFDGSSSDLMPPSELSQPHELDFQYVQQDIYTLWNACCVTFSTMSEFGQQNNQALYESRDRLKLWGSGLFPTGDLHLDLLLGASKAVNEKLADPLASRFVDIALEQLRVIDGLLDSDEGRDTARLKDASTRQKTLLLSTEMTQPILEDFFYASLVETSSAESPTETTESRIMYLRAVVEMLFEYLPSINRLRRSRCLATEEEEIRQARQPKANILDQAERVEERYVSVTSGKQYPSTKTTEEVEALIDDNFAKIREIENDLRSGGRTNEAYAAVFTKERQRLEDWKYDRTMNQVKLNSGESEIMKMQQHLQNLLQPLVEKPPRSSVTAGSSSDASAREEKQALMTEKQLSDAVQCLASTNTHLYGATAQ